jgi:general secretion pathway protein A
MYHQHFGLSGAPFRFTPTPEALYLGKTHREALAALEWGLLREPTGFTVLVGESGVGKTTLVCSLLAHRHESVRAAFITNPRLNFEQLLQVALTQLAPGVRGRDKFELTEGLVRQLEELAPGQRIALILDEAQELADETLEELRLLSNFDAGAEHRLQLIFVGQEELIERLGSERMRSLNQRIGARARLKALSAAETREYVDCRLRAEGGRACGIFAAAALKHLVAHSRGVPRRINVLCHNAMLLGYAAGSKQVTLAMARSAVNDYEDLLGNEQTRAAARAPAQVIAPEAERGRFALRPARWAARAALAASALALAALGAIYLWSAQTLSASGSLDPSLAIRSAAGSKTTGPRSLPRPVASAADPSEPHAVDITGLRLRALDAPVAGTPPPAFAQARTKAARTVANDSSASRASASSAIASDSAAGPRAPRGAAAENNGAIPTLAHPRNVQIHDGDTLWGIAIRYLGSSARFGQLIRANPQLHNVDRIYPGETVYLPPSPAVATR